MLFLKVFKSENGWLCMFAATIILAIIVGQLLPASPNPAPKFKKPPPVSVAPASATHPTAFVGTWDVNWSYEVYRMTFHADGKYKATKGVATWKGEWWVDSSNRFWVSETDNPKLKPFKWSLIPDNNLEGKVDKGAYIGTEIRFRRAKPDA